MKRTLFTLVVLLNVLIGYSNLPLVRNFTRKDYRSGTQNWGITQDENNIMYFANNNGLLSFDGKNWSIVPINNGTNVRSLMYDGKGRFFASTFNEFGYFQKDNNGKLKYFSLTEKLGINPNVSNELYNIHHDDKTVYFQGERLTYLYDGKKIQKINFNYKIDVSAVVHKIYFVASQQAGLFMLNGGLFSRVPGSENLINKKVCAILPYDQQKILVVTSFDGVFLYDGLSLQPFNTGFDSFLKSNQVFCATTNGKQIVYGTVQRGVAIQNLQTGSALFLNTFSGLQNNTVLSAAFDNQQNLWLGLDKGIDYVQLNNPVQNLFGANNLYGAGYTSLIKGNTLLLGTNQGLYTTSYPLNNGPMPLQLTLIKGMEGQIWNLTQIDNTIFCGDDQGAFIVAGNKTERIPGLPGTWAFKQLKCHPEMILGCSYQGLFILKKSSGKWKLSHFIKGKFSESSPMFEEDKDGSIWFSHWQKGLFRLQMNPAFDSIIRVRIYNEQKGFPSNRNNTIFNVGNELIFSSERGFYQLNPKTDKMIPYNKWNKLFATPPSYMRLHEAPNGDVWCVSGRFTGLARKQANNTFKMDSLTYRMLQPKIITGFEHLHFIDSHNLILGTEDGFSWVNTNHRAANQNIFKVILTNIIATNDATGNPDEKHRYSNALNAQAFAHSHNSLRFEWAAPEYRNENLVTYAYKLENYDQSWSEASADNFKEYNQLPSGKYTFKVRAHDQLEAQDAEIAFTFTIEPAWYETKIAFVIYFILFGIVLFGLTAFVNHKSKKGAVEMEKKKELEMKEQKKIFDAETNAKKKEIRELKNQQLQYELRHKSQELASSTMNLIRKNEILLEIVESINKTSDEIRKNTDPGTILSRLSRMEKNIRQNIENDNNWKRFEENFDLVYENYLKRLGDAYPELTVSDKKICAYIKMDLSSKDMAPLLNMSVRSIETNRYRIRKKMGLERDINLADFLQKF